MFLYPSMISYQLMDSFVVKALLAAEKELFTVDEISSYETPMVAMNKVVITLCFTYNFVLRSDPMSKTCK
ncbi:hypothetical protein YC2023_017282 [Brassica napus]